MIVAHPCRRGGLCHRRHRRRAQGCGQSFDVWPISTNWRVRRYRGVGRGQGHPRHREDAGGSGDAGRACGAFGPTSCPPSGRETRPSPRRAARRARRIARFFAAARRSALVAECWSPIRSRRPTRSSRDDGGLIQAAQASGRKTHFGQGGNAVPALEDARIDGRRQPQDQHRAGRRKQRPAGSAHRAGVVLEKFFFLKKKKNKFAPALPPLPCGEKVEKPHVSGDSWISTRRFRARPAGEPS